MNYIGITILLEAGFKLTVKILSALSDKWRLEGTDKVFGRPWVDLNRFDQNDIRQVIHEHPELFDGSKKKKK